MNYRKLLISTFTFLGGLYFFLEFVLPASLPEALGGYEFGKYHSQISNGFIAVGAMAFALGLINLFTVHGSRIVFRKKGNLNSLALLLSLLLMVYLTVNEWMSSERANSRSSDLRNLAAFALRIESDIKENKPTPLPPSERVKLLIAELDKELESINGATENRVQGISEYLYEALNGSLQTVQNERDRLRELVSRSSTIQDNVAENNVPSKLGADSELYKDLNVLSQSINGLSAALQKINELSYKNSSSKLAYDFVYEGFFVPLGSAMFSLLGFYIISAGYRAFRVKGAESGLMMVAAVIVMLGQIPFYIYISDRLPELRLWLLEVPSAAAFRAIKFGAAIAGLYMAVRMWFSIETVSFSENNKGGDL